MNPSSSGWIAKFCAHLSKKPLSLYEKDSYLDLRSYGFTYGINVGLNESVEVYHRYSEVELAKINLMYAFYCSYVRQNKTFKLSDFVLSIIRFYEDYQLGHIIKSKGTFYNKAGSSLKRSLKPRKQLHLLDSKALLAKLETLIDERIQGNEFNILRNHIQTINKALLYIDVLSYEGTQDDKFNKVRFANTLEHLCLNIIYRSFKAKTKLDAFDKEIKQVLKKAKIVETVSEPLSFDFKTADTNQSSHAKQYLFDLACRFSLNKGGFEPASLEFLKLVADELDLAEPDLKTSLRFAIQFNLIHQKDIEQLQNVNVISNLYDSSSLFVSKLIRRNSKRLVREIKQSKELVHLLTKSTYTDLSKAEQKELQLQLVDILKTIPSLAIFLLPGGAILLPLFAKLIPNILPSAFDDNRLED